MSGQSTRPVTDLLKHWRAGDPVTLEALIPHACDEDLMEAFKTTPPHRSAPERRTCRSMSDTRYDFRAPLLRECVAGFTRAYRGVQERHAPRLSFWERVNERMLGH